MLPALSSCDPKNGGIKDFQMKQGKCLVWLCSDRQTLTSFLRNPLQWQAPAARGGRHPPNPGPPLNPLFSLSLCIAVVCCFIAFEVECVLTFPSSIVLCFIEGCYEGPGIDYFTSFEMKCVSILNMKWIVKHFCWLWAYASSEMGSYTLLGC